MTVSFIVRGKARSNRSRVRTTEGGINYVDEKSPAHHWYQLVLAEALQHRPEKPFDEPVGMIVTFIRKKPKRKTPHELWCETTPDLDNCVKLFTDAMEGPIYTDDKYIVYSKVQKVWGCHDEAQVMVGPIDEILEDEDENNG